MNRAQAFGPAAGLRGVVRYTGELAQTAYRLNRFLVFISLRENRQAFLADEEGAMQHWDLTPQHRDLVRRRDYLGMLAAGVNVYAIAKAGYVFGHTLMQIGAQMKEAG